MKNNPNKKIALVIPSLTTGGAERVMSIIANNFVNLPDTEVHVVLLVGGVIFYEIDKRVIVQKPDFDYKDYNRIVYSYLLSKFLRNTLKRIDAEIILTFGGRYNGFVLLNSIGFKAKCFISERSSPLVRNGVLIELVNKIMYTRAAGIIAQTIASKDIMLARYRNRNISVIGNPIQSQISSSYQQRKNIIINVGRFIPSKQQGLLVNIFSRIPNHGWELLFLGEGETLNTVKNQVKNLNLEDKVKFIGNQSNINQYLAQAKIFAFTSSSEGFPNALGEAMGAGCACISFDCVAGPSEIISNMDDGILVPLNERITYEISLTQLMRDETLIQKLGGNAVKKIETNFGESTISLSYYRFMTKSDN